MRAVLHGHNAGALSHGFGALAFAALPNVVMTPHVSGWTPGAIRRRQEAWPRTQAG